MATGVLLLGCASNSDKAKPGVSSTGDAGDVAALSQHDAVIYADEAMLQKPFAIIGGTVENASQFTLRGVSVELELQRRSDGARERRAVKIKPESLAPGERGSYALRILSQEWSDSRLVSLRSENRESGIAFKVAPGNRRPPERLVAPTPGTRAVSAPRPKRRSGDEEFINTPDSPVKVP